MRGQRTDEPRGRPVLLDAKSVMGTSLEFCFGSGGIIGVFIRRKTVADMREVRDGRVDMTPAQ